MIQEKYVAAGMGVLGLFCAGKAIQGYNGPGTLVVAGMVVLVALAVLVLRSVAGSMSATRMVVHTEAHGTDEANIHEAGHWVAAEREGARVSLVKVWPDGSGLVRVHGIRSPEARVAIAAAGAEAEGSWAGGSHDRANLEAAVRSVPRAQRSAVRAEGMRRARQHARHGRVRSYAKRIERNGTIRPWW